MDIVDPRIDPALVVNGSKAAIMNGSQNQYRDLPSVRTPMGQVITRWSPTMEERAAIMRGEDIYVTLLSRGNINPFYVTVGPVDWTLQR
jgi:hypothetical protein